MQAKDACIAGYRLIADALAPYDCRAVAQLFHPGRELYDSVDGSAPVAYAPSAVPDERFHIVPRPLSRPMIQSIVAGFGDAARRVEAGGIDGVEIVASHGYLPVQFLNPRLNLRNDEYGGNFDNRLRFLREVIADIRAKTGPAFTMGMRISGDDLSHDGLDLEAVTENLCDARRRRRARLFSRHRGHRVEPDGLDPYRAADVSRYRLYGAIGGSGAHPRRSPGVLSPGGSTSPRSPKTSSPRAKRTCAA